MSYENRLNIPRETNPGFTTVPSARGKVGVDVPGKQALADAVFTDSMYFMLHHMDFVAGGAWFGWNYERFIVLNEALAWRLFGGLDAVGLTVWVHEQPFTVCGVVRQEKRADGNARVWLPMEAGVALGIGSVVSAFYIQAHDYNEVDIVIHARQLVQGHPYGHPEGYAIVDVNRYAESMGVRMNVLLCLIGLVICIWLFISAFGIADKNRALAVLYGLFGAAIAVLLILGINDILQWLPAMGNPDTKVSLFEVFTNIGVLPPDYYLSYGLARLGRFNIIVNFAWVVSAVGLVGLLVLFFHRRNPK
jgi:hypothetical protein